MTIGRNSLVASFILLCVSTVLAHKNATAGTDTREPYAELTQAPEKARTRRNPLESDVEAPLAGKKLFERHCAECHGHNAEGSKRAPSLRAGEVQGATPGTLFWVMSNGVVRRGMPVWSKLPEPQRWQIIAYLKSLGAAGLRPADEKSSTPIAPIAPQR